MLLTNFPDSAELLSPNAVSEGFHETEIHKAPEFYENLLPLLTDEESKKLTSVLEMYTICNDIDFWLLLYDQSHWELYGKATYTAMNLVEQKELVISDIMSYMLFGENEEIFIAPNKIGPVEVIIFNQDLANQEDFYIYQIDANHWHDFLNI